MQRVVIFDWGRTLHDPETDALFPGVPELVAELSQRYTLALVSLARRIPIDERRRVVAKSEVAGYFSRIFITDGDKDKMYEKVLSELQIDPADVVVVDDRTVRGIAWGNKRGARTIWLCKGKFASEVPNAETGQPNDTITDISELRDLLL